jgi:hypothetical protein
VPSQPALDAMKPQVTQERSSRDDRPTKGVNDMRITPALDRSPEPHPVVLATRHDALFTFWCEWCSRRHIHGGTGHRAAHCTNPRSPYLATGYVLVEVVS